MKDVEFADVTATVPPSPSNGVHHRPPKKKASKKSAKTVTGRERTVAQPIPAEFVDIATGPADAPMWPLHSALWLQPERAAAMPEWTGLAVERRHRIPAPGLLPVETTPLDRRDALDHSCEGRKPAPRRELPPSGLTPLGWDPRAVCRREEK